MKILSSFHCALVLVSALSAACSPSVGPSQPTNQTTFAVTDAPADEVASFVVTFTRLTVTDADGTIIDVLRAPASLDLARLVDFSHVVAQTSLTVSDYVRAEVEIDFDDAVCVLRGRDTPAALFAGDGSPLFGRRSFVIELAGSGAPVTSNRRSVFEFDFDLNASLDVHFAANRVVVEPALLLRVDPVDAKQLTAFGRLGEVDVNSGLCTVDARTEDGLELGDVTFQTNSRTVFQVDGVPLLGAGGLAALAGLPSNATVQAFGVNDVGERNLLAVFVEAGMGTFDPDQDVVEGVVVGRELGSNGLVRLHVLGNGTAASQTQLSFEQLFEVRTRVGFTKVVARADAQAQDLDDVNVGQRITAFGELGDTTMDARTAEDLVRLEPTRLIGVVNGVLGAGAVEIELQQVEARAPEGFAWEQGGPTPVDPSRLSVRFDPLTQGANVALGSSIEAVGDFTRTSVANFDFRAAMLRDLADIPPYLLLRDRFGGLQIDVETSATAIRFEISGTAVADELAVLDNGPTGSTPLAFAPQPRVVPVASGMLCVLHDRDVGTARLFFDFAEFSAEFGLALSSSGRLASFAAQGQHDRDSNVLRATLIVALID